MWKLIHFSLALYKMGIAKQCRPRSDAAEQGVWSESILFALSAEIPISVSFSFQIRLWVMETKAKYNISRTTCGYQFVFIET